MNHSVYVCDLLLKLLYWFYSDWSSVVPTADQLRPASMEHAFALVVLTLLQLCRGEISEPEWFAANLVNEPGYTPKPITEIFTSDSPGTSKNPALFTQPTTGTTSTLPPTPRPTPNIAVVQNGNPPPSQNGGSPVQKTPELTSQVVENPPKNELPNFLIVFDPRGPVNPVQPSVVPPSPPTSPQTQATTQNQPTTATSTSSTSQSTMSIPSTQGTLPTFQPENPQQILINSSAPAFQSGSPQPILTNTNNISPAAWPPGTLVFPLQFPSANPTALPIPTTASPILPPVPQPAGLVNSKPVLTVRVKAPQGSITNIHINPTTTVRPSTTRRQKSTRRTNNFESCMNACKGKKEPICSSPVGLNPINPDRLKGFPSLCHMACHNSFKKELYEKVTDGRCGKLRTRIRPVDKKKLNREELNKAQYTIVHNAPDTVVEFSPVRQ
ncbi:mucin-2-like isoform X2 [Maniola jurtina]|uniref:mucin-2-like isoform X2 n=1 Tax=Maniola jurtina TaxID=191418 RepID=UPI001E68BF21|nr:mucin-2-like isoform X2 [Maniola jurtina]